MRIRLLAALAAAAACVLCLSVPASADWAQPNGDLGGTRAVRSAITSTNAGRLHVHWRFRLTRGSTFGAFASTPLVVGSTVYLQDLSSSVHALDLESGKPKWQYIVQAPNDGPNGLAFAAGRLFGATDTRVFALDARTGRHLWGHKLTNRHEQFVDSPPRRRAASSSRQQWDSRRAGAARSTPWISAPGGCAGASTRSGIRGRFPLRGAEARGTPHRSHPTGASTSASPILARGEARRFARTAACSPALLRIPIRS